MANSQIKARSNRPASSELTLYDPDVGDTGYTPLLEGRDFGNAEWDLLFSGPRGTQGARAIGAIPQNRRLVLPFRVRGSSKDDLHDRLSALHALADELKRYGGRVTWRAQGETFRQHFEVMAATAGISDWPKRYDHSHIVTQVLSGICAPYLLHDPFDIVDGFDTDTSADYAEDAVGANFAIAGGALVPGTTGVTRWRHTARGYSYSDVQTTLKITTGSTVASYDAHVFINGDTAGVQTFLSAQLFGGNLRLIKWVAGAQTVLASTAFSVATNTSYWLRIRREGRLTTVEVFTAEPTLLTTPAATASFVLAVDDHNAYATGQCGFRINVVDTGERYDDFTVHPYTYSSSFYPPDERTLRGEIPGDSPALVDLVVASGDSGAGAPIFALFGWWRRPAIYNDCWNGDFEVDVDGWSIAAVSGVTGAASSLARDTTAARNKYGIANAQVGCPATANTGTTFKLRRRYLAGKAYLLIVWASSAAGTTNARCRFGVSGDIASCGAKALSPTPSIYPVVWTPTANRDDAYACQEITAATLTNMNIDAVVVCEAREVPLGANLTNIAGTATLARDPEDWPEAPFLAIVEPSSSTKAEIVRVESRSGVTLTLTRGLEGTTSQSHTAPVTVIPLPEFRKQYEGAGAPPPVGILEAESADLGNLFTWAVASTSSLRMGEWLTASGIGSAGSAFADWLIDPNLLVPDDYAGTEIAVEIWGRLAIHDGLTSPKAILSVAPESATVASGVISSDYGHIRYSEEWGSAGRALQKQLGGVARVMYRLGTVRLTVDRARPLRTRLGLKITWTAATAASVSADYLMLVPLLGRALSPSGKDNDADYPAFLETGNEAQKTVRPDLSGLVAKPGQQPYPDHGLGGSLLELPNGNVDAFLKLSQRVPDDSLPNTEAFEYHVNALHLAVTPRSAIARGST